ncbi:MAG: nuclear transport factor 2 family protein [Polyangiaceae bacterium]|nr:nuclear transport factor 2 family protein [Polyangiaceae bacterium]
MAMGRSGKITRAFFDAYNRRDWDALSARLAPSVTWFNAARRELIQGPEAVLALLRSSAEAFPEARIELHAVHEAASRSIAEWSYVTPGGKKSRHPTVCDVIELSRGRIARGTTYGDTLQILLELGQPAAPIPPVPGAPSIRFAAA